MIEEEKEESQLAPKKNRLSMSAGTNLDDNKIEAILNGLEKEEAGKRPQP